MALKTALAAMALAAAGAAGWVVLDTRPPSPPAGFAARFPTAEGFEFDPPAPGSYDLLRIKPAPDGELLDIHGNLSRLSDLMRDRITLVSFVYLSCGDIGGCPLAMSVLFDIHEASLGVPGLGDEVQLMTISFDPERDTVEAIGAFAYPISIDRDADRKLPWQVLTAPDQAALQPILDGFGQVVNRSGDQETINHVLRMYLVDRQGQIRNIYGLGLIDPRLLMSDVETLLQEEGTG
ncbi:SCO family protein [Pukyongiella litopenaei]|uniref:SCO family protein n=1 Tax=Pukyongiella litopenaei TaxID=2605946 RepID=A0A2S0MRY1_9RHOB|nr:SCO family protein [Pukyongiella litopenaei]AVO38463.1 SCO family protein [Pukyongiella litopenaei]